MPSCLQSISFWHLLLPHLQTPSPFFFYQNIPQALHLRLMYLLCLTIWPPDLCIRGCTVPRLKSFLPLSLTEQFASVIPSTYFLPPRFTFFVEYIAVWRDLVWLLENYVTLHKSTIGSKRTLLFQPCWPQWYGRYSTHTQINRQISHYSLHLFNSCSSAFTCK